MNHLFVPYELAKKLEEKEFIEPCFGVFNKLSSGKIDFIHKKWGANGMQTLIPAPIYQQVIDWLEQKHNIYISSHVSASTMDEFGKLKREYKILKVSEFKYKIGQSCRQKKADTLNEAIEESLKLIP